MIFFVDELPQIFDSTFFDLNDSAIIVFRQNLSIDSCFFIRCRSYTKYNEIYDRSSVIGYYGISASISKILYFNCTTPNFLLAIYSDRNINYTQYYNMSSVVSSNAQYSNLNYGFCYSKGTNFSKVNMPMIHPGSFPEYYCIEECNLESQYNAQVSLYLSSFTNVTGICRRLNFINNSATSLFIFVKYSHQLEQIILIKNKFSKIFNGNTAKFEFKNSYSDVNLDIPNITTSLAAKNDFYIPTITFNLYTPKIITCIAKLHQPSISYQYIFPIIIL